MHKFSYRAPRFQADFAVHLKLHNLNLRARCTEISIEGMRVETAEPLTRDTLGTVSFLCSDSRQELSVRVAHTSSMGEGLEFIYGSERERAVVTRLIADLTTQQHGVAGS
jgi:hypothetical protein